MANKQQHVDLSDWMESQSKDYAPSSLDRYLSQPDSPRWELCESSSSKLLSPSLIDQLSTQYAKGEKVAVRCNRHKWLLGEVKRLSARGIRVWVGEAGLLVNIPRQLLTTHLLKMSSLQGLHSLPPAGPMIVAPPGSTDCRYPVQCVRPAHLSHRQLYLPVAVQRKKNNNNACAICGQAVIVEDDAVAPWDCDHNCHIDCIQDKPRFFSTTTCPVCKEQQSSSYSPSSSSPSSPSPYDHHIWPVARDKSPTTEEPCSLSQQQLHTIDEESRTAAPRLKPALKKQSGSFEEPPPPPPPVSIPSSAATSLADRMKKFSMLGACIEPHHEQSVESAWLTVIRNGQNTRQTDSQQKIENIARAKENTFSVKAAKRQQEQHNNKP